MNNYPNDVQAHGMVQRDDVEYLTPQEIYDLEEKYVELRRSSNSK